MIILIGLVINVGKAVRKQPGEYTAMGSVLQYRFCADQFGNVCKTEILMKRN